jgi:AcrR family transcriptional regulator
MGASGTPTRRYRGQTAEERGAERRARLLHAALDIIGERGWQDATMTEICRVAGLTERYFYESFRSRDELYIALIDQLGAEFLSSVLAAVDLTAAPRERVQAAAGAVVAFLVGDPRRGRAALMEGVGNSELERRRRQIIVGLADAIADRWDALFGLEERSPQWRTATATAIAGMVAALAVRRLEGTLDLDDAAPSAFVADAALQLATSAEPPA